MSTEPSPKKGFKPSRLLKLSSGRAMSKQTSTIRQKTPSLREQPPREAQLHRKRIVPPTEGRDADPLGQKQTLPNGNSCLNGKNPRGITRRHTLGGPHCPADPMVDPPAEPTAKEPSDMHKKREAFLKHLKQKYPHHASTIMNQQGQLRQQSRTCQPPAGDPVGHTAASLDSLDAMSEGEVPPIPPAFNRGSRMRASLPVVRSTNQTRDRSLGVLYLQYGEETKQIYMPNEITSLDTILALFVSAFPQHLSMKTLESPTVAVYIRDDSRNMYYELTDVRTITDQTCLKVYHRDPSQAFGRKTRSSNGDLRVQHTGREGYSVMSPATAHGLTPPVSSSRIPYGTRGSSGSTRHINRDPLSSASCCTPTSPGTSAILKRWDVKPDEDSPLTLSPLSDVVDHRVATSNLYPSTAPPVDPAEHPSLYRQKSMRHGESQLPNLGTRTSPLSPHKPQQPGPLDRVAPARTSLRKDSSGEAGVKIQSGVTLDLSDPQTRERMKAMEEQIASLTGLVQHALLMGPNTKATKETCSEKSPLTMSLVSSVDGGGGSPVLTTGSSLVAFSRSISDLRQKLEDMRELQLQNQESFKLMLQQMEREIVHKVVQTARCLDDPAQRQRMLVEEERHEYLGMEEGILLQLGELEHSVDALKEHPESGTGQHPITLQELEDCTVRLRSVGDALVTLRGGFPALQSKMRAVLRVEVEAVRFLKEEPHKLESMMKRVKTLTERLGALRRCITENDDQCSQLTVDEVAPKDHVTTVVASEPITAHKSPAPSVAPQKAPDSPIEPPSSSFTSEVVPTSPVVVHHSCSSPVHLQKSQQSATLSRLPSPPVTPPSSQDPPQSGKTSPAVQKCTPLDVNSSVAQRHFVRSRSKAEQRAASIAAAKVEWEEQQHNLSRYDRTEFDRLLQEAQDSCMISISNLEVTDQKADQQVTPPVEAVDTPPSMVLLPEEIPLLEPAAKGPVKSSTDRPAEGVAETASQHMLDNGGSIVSSAGPDNKSPPPPPPRRTHPPGSCLTTGRLGEMICTVWKDPVMPQEAEGKAISLLQPKPKTTPPPKLVNPSPAVGSSIHEDEDEEDEGDRIMAELQVFQKCTVQDIGPRCLTKPQVEEMWAGEDEVQYHAATKISKEQLPPGTEHPRKHREGATTSKQVQSVNTYSSSPGIQKLPTGKHPAASGSWGVVGQSHLPRAQCAQLRVCVDYLSENARTQEDLKIDSSTSSVQLADDISIERDREQKGSTPIPIQNPCSRVVMIPQGTKSPDVKVQEATGNLESLPESLFKNQDQVAVLRSSRAYMKIAQETVLNPVLPCDEATPTPDNIAFKITDTEVQALSCGEYEEIMNTEGGNIQTINVSEAREMTSQEESSLGKKPVIIILDEPMDIRSAYKRLSTIFEGEEEPDQMLEENRIEEVPEENDLERNVLQDYLPKDERPKTTLGENTQNYNRPSKPIIQHHKATLDCSLVSAERAGYEKQDPKKKFKLKFPKKKLTALSQAIQTGTKTGKKTLQVVVYEDEEEADGTVKMAKETKRFEIGLHKSSSECTSTEVTGFQLDLSGFQRESDEFCNSASLEQTIKKSEACGTIIGSCPTIEPGAEDPKTSLTTLMEPIVKDAVMEGPISPNGSTSPPCKAIKAPKPRFPKPPPPPRPSVIPHSPTKSHQNTSFSSVASRSPSAVPRVLPDTTDKAKKQQKLPEHQSQFRQANGSARKAAKATFPGSKIPAFAPSSGKSSSLSAANPAGTNHNPSTALCPNNPAQGHHTIVPPIQAEDHPFSTVVHKFLAASE